MINYEYLLKIKYRSCFLSLILLGILVITLVLSFFLETYNSYYTVGIYNENLTVSVPLANSDAVISGDYLAINQRKYNYEIINISPLQIQNNLNYQIYDLKLTQTFKENEVVEITFYYNKQKIIKRIIDIIF